MDFARLPDDLRRRCVDTLRFLSIDAVEKAKSGHPGLPMGAADMAFVMWTRFHRFHAADPSWPNRDRFVFSPGHGSMLLYSLLHLTGHDLPMGELQQFRQWGSKTPGHPEYGMTPGVEVTTGPLGQGISHAVGIALAQRHLAARLGTPDFSPLDYRVWGVCSDGDLMEGVSAEAASLAGHLKLGNLVFLYDSNKITIDGSTDLTFTEDVGRRFESYGWHVQHVDGHDHEAVAGALAAARDQGEKPSLVIARTTIGFGSPNKAGSSKVHGAPLGPDEAAKTREARGWPKETFLVPDDVREVFRARAAENAKAYADWKHRFTAWRDANPERAALWDGIFGGVPADLEAQLVEAAGAPGVATRATGGKVINRAAELVPALVGGSADLDESTMTYLKGSSVAKAGAYGGRNIHFGIREHAMAAVVNGLTLSGLRGFGATFLVFSDYARPSVRLAALMGCPSIFVFTHDSVFLGEDGPTHQPIEHVSALRLIPNLEVWRPADPREVALAWAGALRRTTGPSVLSLTRQKLPALAGRNPEVPTTADECAAYVVHEPEGGPEAVLIATGSEVPIAIEGAKACGRRVRVVSMPNVERFLQRTRAERERLLPKGLPVAAAEAGRTDLWRQFTGLDGLVIGIDTFGHSAPAEVIAEHLGFTGPAIAEKLRGWLA